MKNSGGKITVHRCEEALPTLSELVGGCNSDPGLETI